MNSVPATRRRTVNLLFTDIEGSTRAWERNEAAMSEALARHDDLLSETIERCGGHVFKRVGDAFCATFPTAAEGLQAALEAQRALARESESPRVRMALHTGSAEQRDGDYFGPALNRISRLIDAGHGGQVLVSGSAGNLLEEDLPDGARLRDLGEHRLKDLQRPMKVYQLIHPALQTDFPSLRSLDPRRNNLPVQLTAFIGRERALEELGERLERDRLVTLTGPGGTGKTRLATQVAAEAVDAFDGVWLVELAPLTEPDLVTRSVATTLGVREEPGRDVTATITSALEDMRTLLVLDNCEQVIEETASLVDRLLRRSENLVILATSREPLDIPGEVVWEVPPLGVPTIEEVSTTGEIRRLEAHEAVRLFVDRARLNRSDFRVTERNALPVAEVCRRLDGIPLAIELAAARIRALSPEQIAERLDDRFTLLTGGGRTTLPRHRTLRAAIDWSYDLLEEPEKALFRRLSVFAGGWTLEAAEAVVPELGDKTIAVGEVLDLLARLVDKSLVTMEETDQGGWYRCPETLREYARQRLHDDGVIDVETIRRRHRDWYLELTRKADAGLETVHRARWMSRLERERDNLRAAVEWSLEREGEVERGLRMSHLSRMFWWRRGSDSEVIDWLERGLESEADLEPATRVLAMHALGMAYSMQNRVDEAERWAVKTLELALELSDRALVMRGNILLAQVAFLREDYASSTDMYEEALEIAQEQGDERAMTVVLNNLGENARIQGDLERARAHYLRVLERFPAEADLDVLAFNLGQLDLEAGNPVEAGERFRESLRIGRETSRGFLVYGILGVAQALAGTERFEDAALLFGAAEAERTRTKTVIHPADMEPIERSVEAIREVLAEEDVAELWSRGRALSLDEAVALALGETEDLSP